MLSFLVYQLMLLRACLLSVLMSSGLGQKLLHPGRFSSVTIQLCEILSGLW